MSRMAEASTILRTCAVAAAFIPGIDCAFALSQSRGSGFKHMPTHTRPRRHCCLPALQNSQTYAFYTHTCAIGPQGADRALLMCMRRCHAPSAMCRRAGEQAGDAAQPQTFNAMWHCCNLCTSPMNRVSVEGTAVSAKLGQRPCQELRERYMHLVLIGQCSTHAQWHTPRCTRLLAAELTTAGMSHASMLTGRNGSLGCTLK